MTGGAGWDGAVPREADRAVAVHTQEDGDDDEGGQEHEDDGAVDLAEDVGQNEQFGDVGGGAHRLGQITFLGRHHEGASEQSGSGC